MGTILLGDFSEKENALVISDYIEAKYTESTAATLTFTHRTWEYVNDEKDKKYKDKKIVGWQHTHPGYGIFLSRYDLFIQENFFNLPWQVAYVVDPVADKRGFFSWDNLEIVKMVGFYVYDEDGKKIKLKKDKKHPEYEKFKKYIVQEGDTLEQICIENNIDYKKNIKKIKKINSLNDKEQLCEGQTLFFP